MIQNETWLALQDVFTDLSAECHRIADEKGFYDDYTHTVREQLSIHAKLHEEIAEMTDAVSKPGLSDKIPQFTKLEEEMADIFIRLFDYMIFFDTDTLANAIRAKLTYNESRPYRHGKTV